MGSGFWEVGHRAERSLERENRGPVAERKAAIRGRHLTAELRKQAEQSKSKGEAARNRGR